MLRSIGAPLPGWQQDAQWTLNCQRQSLDCAPTQSTCCSARLAARNELNRRNYHSATPFFFSSLLSLSATSGALFSTFLNFLPVEKSAKSGHLSWLLGTFVSTFLYNYNYNFSSCSPNQTRLLFFRLNFSNLAPP